MKLRDVGAALYFGLALILLLLFIVGVIYPISVQSRHAAVSSSVPTILPIRILGNEDLTAPGSTSGCKCATLENGTWVIGPWSISKAPWDGVYIDGVTAPFELRNMKITNSGGAGIHLKNIHPINKTIVVSGTQTSIENNLVGILVEGSSNLILDGGGSNPNGSEVSANGAIGSEIVYVNVTSITVKGWQTNTTLDAILEFVAPIIVTVAWAIAEIAGIALLIGILIAIPGINMKTLSGYFVSPGHR